MAQEGNIVGFDDLGENNMSNNFADKHWYLWLEDTGRNFNNQLLFTLPVVE